MNTHHAIARVALVSSLFLVACADKEYIAEAEKSVRLLHEELKQPNFDAVWLKAASEFQRAIQRTESNTALASIPESVRKAPRVQSDRPRLRYFMDILYVQLYYQIEVGQGDKYEETVTYKLDHGFSTLARYELSGSGIQVVLDGPMQCRQPSRRALSVILLPAPGERTHCPDFRSGA